jgi:hypothetical protein
MRANTVHYNGETRLCLIRTGPAAQRKGRQLFAALVRVGNHLRRAPIYQRMNRRRFLEAKRVSLWPGVQFVPAAMGMTTDHWPDAQR